MKFKVGDRVIFDKNAKTIAQEAHCIAYNQIYTIKEFNPLFTCLYLEEMPSNPFEIRRFKLANSAKIRERLGVK